MRHTNLDMTFPALSRRAAEVNTDYTVADVLNNGDDREITVFLTHDQSDLGGNSGYRLESKEVIGVALCDLDDPLAAPEVLTRDDAVELFGISWVEDRESME